MSRRASLPPLQALPPSSSPHLPTPSRIFETSNYKESAKKSSLISSFKVSEVDSKRIIVIGGGLSGLACAKYLTDAGHKPVVLEARDVLGGKVSAWQDKDGDWIETGLHIFFGAYPNMMNLFSELSIHDRLQWKPHRMTFAMPKAPGTFTSFEFPPNVPAPFNMAAAILSNNEMLGLIEKIQMVPGLLPMLLEGQEFIDQQDELSVAEFMDRYGMPETVKEEIFIAMGKALDFMDPDKLSMSVILTAMNRFINEADGSQTAFIDGNQPDRLCKPMADYVVGGGGEVRTRTPVREIITGKGGRVEGVMTDEGVVEGDLYVSAMPVDVVKRIVPKAWSSMPFFRQMKELEGVPVINIQIWFDRKLPALDGLCFSRSPLLSVYADMSVCCEEYFDPDKSMLELVFAPAIKEAGADRNWISETDEVVLEATLKELERIFSDDIKEGGAKVEKYTVVRVPRSVYATTPGRNKFRPSQKTPIENFVMAGDFTSQKFLGSMEGAVLAGKLAAEVIASNAVGDTTGGWNKAKVGEGEKKKPVGIKGNHPIAFGGGQEVMGQDCYHP